MSYVRPDLRCCVTCAYAFGDTSADLEKYLKCRRTMDYCTSTIARGRVCNSNFLGWVAKDPAHDKQRPTTPAVGAVEHAVVPLDNFVLTRVVQGKKKKPRLSHIVPELLANEPSSSVKPHELPRYVPLHLRD